MTKKIKFSSVLLFSLVIVFSLYGYLNYKNVVKITKDKKVATDNNIRLDNKINTNNHKNINFNSNNPNTIVQKKDSQLINNKQNKSLPAIKKDNEISVESAFLIKGMGVDMKFLEGMKDGEIFDMSINSLEDESFGNKEAQKNRKYYNELILQDIQDYMNTNENSNIDILNLQCGISSCLSVMSSNDEPTWRSFFNSFLENAPENSIFTTNDVSYIDASGNTLHRIFFSIDEDINAIVIPPKE
jgi:hypothetical protein